MLTHTSLDQLHREFSYPKEVLSIDVKASLNMCKNDMVWDLKTGNILEIEGSVIKTGWSGWNKIPIQKL
jgi:uncharacterized oligopeptide transporter (OPT) family protein